MGREWSGHKARLFRELEGGGGLRIFRRKLDNNSPTDGYKAIGKKTDFYFSIQKYFVLFPFKVFFVRPKQTKTLNFLPFDDLVRFQHH